MTAAPDPAEPAPEPADHADFLECMRERIAALALDLSGLSVVTEAATGSYACTPVIAALAGAAQVTCTARDTVRYGSFEDAAAATMALAAAAGVADRIDIRRSLAPEVFAGCDILTNSGHLRPITADTIVHLPTHAVVALMFEAWEFREGDLDLAACRARGIRVAAVNERHPDVAVFVRLGPLSVRLLEQNGVSLARSSIALLCDNPFAPFLRDGLRARGAEVTLRASPAELPSGPYQAVVIALDPTRNAPLDEVTTARLCAAARQGIVAQFWGDIDPAARSRHAEAIRPATAPGRGHMGILLSALGHDPIVRLQTGGLRAAEVVLRRLSGPAALVAERI